jgi:uncharacterized damage-inducible protein DinB
MTASHPPSAAAGSATLSPAELLYGDFPAEYAATRRILERYPDGKGSWRPHERSRSLDQLATHVADIIYRGVAVLETDGMELGSRPQLPLMDSAHDLLAHFEAGLARFTSVLASADFDNLAQPWALRRDGRVLIQHPRRILLRQMMMSHLVHHRAQLGVYYRLLGVPVPGAYGPSADD